MNSGYHKAEVKSDCVSLNAVSMSWAKTPALSALVTQGKEERREREKQRKAFILVSQNLLRLYVRVRGRTEGVGGRAGSAGCWRGGRVLNGSHSSLSVGTHTNTLNRGRGIPLGSAREP